MGEEKEKKAEVKKVRKRAEKKEVAPGSIID
jgi:hypothetical protein